MAAEQSQTSPMGARSLEGVRVLDLSRVFAGPWSTQNLGDLGADVVKVEAPDKGDDTRTWGPPFLPQREGVEKTARESAYYLCCNRNKRSLVVDFTTPKGSALIREMAKKADIVVENFRVGGLAKYGLDYASLHKINPKLVYCSVTGFGQDGPYANRGGYDFVAQGMGGLMSLTGQPDGTPGSEPLKTGVAICDLFTGMYATVAILAALRHAERTGVGQHLDCALFDSQIAMLANQGLSYLVAGVMPKLLGNAHPTVVPYRTFQASDGPIVVACGNDGQFRGLCGAIGRDDIAKNPDYSRNSARILNRAALEADLQSTMAHFDVATLMKLFVAAGVPAGPINTLDRVFADEQTKARNTVHHFTRADGVDIPTVAFPPKMSETPAVYTRPPPELGEHTEVVLHEWLGMSDADISGLEAEKIIQK